jgi:hypothetical protein
MTAMPIHLEQPMRPPDHSAAIGIAFDALPPLPGEAAAQILEVLHQLAEQFESRFYGQLRRHADGQRPFSDTGTGPFSETDPPF